MDQGQGATGKKRKKFNHDIVCSMWWESGIHCLLLQLRWVPLWPQRVMETFARLWTIELMRGKLLW